MQPGRQPRVRPERIRRQPLTAARATFPNLRRHVHARFFPADRWRGRGACSSCPYPPPQGIRLGQPTDGRTGWRGAAGRGKTPPQEVESHGWGKAGQTDENARLPSPPPLPSGASGIPPQAGAAESRRLLSGWLPGGDLRVDLLLREPPLSGVGHRDAVHGRDVGTLATLVPPDPDQSLAVFADQRADGPGQLGLASWPTARVAGSRETQTGGRPVSRPSCGGGRAGPRCKR
jgi:hypothetical protein